MPSLPWIAHLLIWVVMSQTAQAAAPMAMSKKDLMARMRQQTTDADACFRLLHANGAVGCASDGAVEAPVRMMNSSGTDVMEDSIMLTGADDRDAFLTRLAGSTELQRHVKGVLVDATTGQLAPYAPVLKRLTLSYACMADTSHHCTAVLGQGCMLTPRQHKKWLTCYIVRERCFGLEPVPCGALAMHSCCKAGYPHIHLPNLILIFPGPGRAKLHCVAGTQPSQESSAATNPAWQYAPDPRPGYQWNPAGSAVARLELDIPVMLLGSAAAPDAQTRAQQNARQAFKGAVHHARLESVMWGADNSSACIQSQTCLPLGGHSVWAAVPPLQAGAPARQIVLALAPIDSAAFFRSKAVVSTVAGLEAGSNAVEPAGAKQHTLHTLLAGCLPLGFLPNLWT